MGLFFITAGLTRCEAEALAVDSGSEVDEGENLTVEQIREILEEEQGHEGDEEGHESELENEGHDTGPIVWTDDFSMFHGNRASFEEDVGPKIDDTSPSEIFCKFWNQPIIEMIVEETNRHAWQTICQATESETGIPSHSRINDWVETSVSEIYRLFAVIILMGICLFGRIDEYWRSGLLEVPNFKKIMSKDRYLLLMRFIHFVDNDCITDRGNDRKIAKISPLLNYLINKCQATYSPRQELSIDESLLLWKGRLSWVQCIRTKAARFGIKT